MTTDRMIKSNSPAAAEERKTTNLNRIAHFVAVVEERSFTAAAERLGLTKSVVSRQVARLEHEVQTSLLVRTTRRVYPTAAGQAFFDRCVGILADADQAFSSLTEESAEPSGILSITAPFDLGLGVVLKTTKAFTDKYPRCKVDLHLTDKSLDLMEQGLDLGIRSGWLRTEHLQARRIGDFRQMLVAPASWVHAVQAITRPMQIADYPFVANKALREHSQWRFVRDEEVETVRVEANIMIDTTLAVREAVILGAGLSVLPDFVVQQDIAEKRLVHVLPDWHLRSGSISAVFPSMRFRPVKVRAFVDMLSSLLGERRSSGSALGAK